MKEIKELIGYRSNVRLVDASLRDGGLVNDFYFSDEKALTFLFWWFIIRTFLKIKHAGISKRS